MGNHAPRWEGDHRGVGIGDGGWIQDDLLLLLEAVTAPDWIAEEPELHLLPHLERACQTTDYPLSIESSESRDTVFQVDLRWTGAGRSRSEIRGAVYAIMGEISESVSFVRQCFVDGRIEFVACTGILEGDSSFAGHGHLIHFIVRTELDRHGTIE